MTRIIDFAKHNAIALAALFIALGGSSYAAVAIPKASVGAAQLRNGAVTSSKVRAGAVTPDKLASNAFGGRILYFAEVTSGGFVVQSSPQGIKTENWANGSGGVISFPHGLPKGCYPLAGVSSPLPAAQTPSVSAVRESPSQVLIQMSGPAGVTLEIVCGG